MSAGAMLFVSSMHKGGLGGKPTIQGFGDEKSPCIHDGAAGRPW
jgi:hypothetical protein